MATASSPSNRVLRFGVFELDTHTGELRKSGKTIRLRPQAARVLTALATRPAQLVTREELKDQIWGQDTFVDFEHGLNLCIQQIRAALDDDADTPRYVETLPRRGYRFIAPVQDSSKKAAVPPQPVQPIPVTPAAPIPRSRFHWWQLSLIGGIVVVIVGLIAWANPAEWRTRFFGGSTAPARTIAVLPLLNLTGDANQDYFADGMTEALTTDLAQIENMQVISRSSTMQYKGVKKPLPVIARELHADAIVEGSVQRVGNRVRVTAQLIRASTDRHLWAETYERDFRDILALQDDVASAIAMQIENRLGGPRPLPAIKAQAIDPQAYETYLKANYYLDQFDLVKSFEYYNDAIKLDPNYAPAYAHLARAYFFLGFFDAIPPSQAWGKVKELALLAIAKDDRLPEGHGALALAKVHYDWDFAGGEQEFKRALELNPNDADIRHDYAHYLMAMGRMNDSAAESQRAVDLDPVDDGLTDCLCWHSFAARKYDESIRTARDVLGRHPDDAFELVILGWDYEQKGMKEEAVTEFKKAVELTRSDTLFSAFYLAGLGHAYALSGRKADAEQVLQTLIDRTKKSYTSPFDIATIYAALGDKEKAFAWMDRAVADRSSWLVYSKWEPRLNPLRSDPRFEPLLKKIGLPAEPRAS